MRRIVLALLLILIPSIARAQIAGQSCPASGQAATNMATGLTFLCTQVAGVLQWVQQPPAGGGGSSFPVTSAVAVNSGGSITVNTGGSIVPAGTGTVTATNATTPLTVSSAGNGNGVLALSGNTSGTSTFTAPAVAGTSTNGVTMSNNLIAPNGTLAAPSYAFAGNSGAGMWWASNVLHWTSSGSDALQLNLSNNLVLLGIMNASGFNTATNCSSSASPAVCGSASAGSVVVAAAASTVQVNTTFVTASSQILLARDDSLGTKLSVTCNTATAAGDIKVSARTGGTSFTITVQNAPATNPLCLSYLIIN